MTILGMFYRIPLVVPTNPFPILYETHVKRNPGFRLVSIGFLWGVDFFRPPQGVYFTFEQCSKSFYHSILLVEL